MIELSPGKSPPRLTRRRAHAALLPFATILLLPCLAKSAATEKTVEIMVEDAASPWSKADGTGFANDVVVAAFREAGITVKLDVVPYSRCKKAALAGTTPACFSMTWLPQFEGSIVMASEHLIALNSDVFENVAKPLPKPGERACELPKGAVAGVVRDYEYPPETTTLAAGGVVFDPSNADEANLKRLASARIDAAIVITNDIEPRNQKAVESGTADRVRFAFNCGHETGTIGFSLKHPDGRSLHEQYEAGYKRIKENGTLAGISARWQH